MFTLFQVGKRKSSRLIQKTGPQYADSETDSSESSSESSGDAVEVQVCIAFFVRQCG